MMTSHHFPHISVAPMMGCTDRHARYFLRLLAPDIRLYTEMLTAQALLYGPRQALLAFDIKEKYLALQLGGNDPEALAICAQWAEEAGYDEVNLNVGCPSPRVRSGQFGACLMLEPQRVAECMAAMQAKTKIPITLKCRIGVDHQDSYEQLQSFIQLIAATGCQMIIVHARKAWLEGLSPKQNREIPPLRYDIVYRLKSDFPHLQIILNGGIQTCEQVSSHLRQVDGVMIGREAYANPYLLAQIQAHYTIQPPVTRQEVMENLIPYISQALKNGVKLHNITRHILGLFHGFPGAASFRRYLSENVHQSTADVQVLKKALTLISE